MTIICNATPLINFAAINRLDILQAVFEKVIIPQAVYSPSKETLFFKGDDSSSLPIADFLLLTGHC